MKFFVVWVLNCLGFLGFLSLQPQFSTLKKRNFTKHLLRDLDDGEKWVEGAGEQLNRDRNLLIPFALILPYDGF